MRTLKENIKNIIKEKISNLLIKLNKKDINNYVEENIIKLNLTRNNIKEQLLYLLENDANFLIIFNSLNSIRNFIEKKYNIKSNEDEINDIIIDYLNNTIKKEI